MLSHFSKLKIVRLVWKSVYRNFQWKKMILYLNKWIYWINCSKFHYVLITPWKFVVGSIFMIMPFGITAAFSSLTSLYSTDYCYIDVTSMATLLFHTDQFIYGIKETIKQSWNKSNIDRLSPMRIILSPASFWEYQFL